ncbi:MAG: membrane protein insertion efficiency factor YidD [Burkholderiales bacterium]|nr:membrane protein insertion efficiency factor YidD [Burkholderiales bacterium]MDE1925975.1 membrane protein insertion efficiency factor YidD [Burkholderiales bacterium]MDE2160076.1 membrane protein insertion efficiency factor YidD [Burkholderiales bacterium]MDE2501432.1 membrane protein insertion efficiency factor YidD [Burkholderiales bacterium]
MLAILVRLPRQALILLVRGYRLLLSPSLGNVCRFTPSCSAYALEALQQHGALGGSLLTAGRILRCQPWCEGGCDPVPLHFPNPARGLFSRLGIAREAASETARATTARPAEGSADGAPDRI